MLFNFGCILSRFQLSLCRNPPPVGSLIETTVHLFSIKVRKVGYFTWELLSLTTQVERDCEFLRWSFFKHWEQLHEMFIAVIFTLLVIQVRAVFLKSQRKTRRCGNNCIHSIVLHLKNETTLGNEETFSLTVLSSSFFLEVSFEGSCSCTEFAFCMFQDSLETQFLHLLF